MEGKDIFTFIKKKKKEKINKFSFPFQLLLMNLSNYIYWKPLKAFKVIKMF